MNQQTDTKEDKKNPLLKFLAIILFVIIITFCAWAAVRLVTLLPTAFSSLANLAETVYKHDPYATENITLSVENNVSETQHNQTININWNEIKTDGSFAFSYECVEGIEVSILIDSNTYQVTCGEYFYLPANTARIGMHVKSEKMSVAYMPYSISFLPDDSDLDTLEDTHILTITNEDIPDRLTENDLEVEDTTEETEETTDEPVTPQTPATRTIKVYDYALPTSDPNGYTDLVVEYIGVGTVSTNGAFTAKSQLQEGDNGAFQFSVKNIGTKTSSNWEFEGHTTAGANFESGSQKPLKPNERSVITIGFENSGNDGYRSFDITVRGGNDISSNNNSFKKTVVIN